MDNLENNLKIVDKSFLMEAFQTENFQISDKKAELLIRFYELLVQKNRVMNLTGITEFPQVVYKHFLDSVYGVRVMNDVCCDLLRDSVCDDHLSDVSHVSVIDVGTGAGFPGIPLKIYDSGLNITLMDSLNKRVGFLNEVISELGLSGIRAVHSRAEDLGRNPEYRERFDYGVSRAVADLSVLSEYVLPFVKTGGTFIAYKSGNIEEELRHSEKAIEILGGRVVEVKSFSYDIKIFSDDVQENGEETCRRSLIVIEKIKETAKKYPRKAGTPGKMPLR